MTTDFRALCVELTDCLEKVDWPLRHRYVFRQWIDIARTALADEPAVPTVMEIVELSSEIEAAGLGQVDFARAVLARWGNPATEDSSATQPVDGEVEELEAWLREIGDTIQPSHLAEHQRYKRAAELLQHLSPPQPVPVSERLPGPGEMTEDGEVWVDDPGHDYPIADSGDYGWEPHKWIMRPISRFDAKYGRRWLPAHALPIPHQQENAND